MKANLKINKQDLRRILDSINGPLASENEDADVHLQIDSDLVSLYTRPDPIQVYHSLQQDPRFTIEVESTGRLSFNIETLVNIMKNSPSGQIELVFTNENYRVRMPEEEEFSEPLEFLLPRITQSTYRNPKERADFHKIDSISYEALRNKLKMFLVLDEHLNIGIAKGNLSIQVDNPVTGKASIKRKLSSDTEVTKMSQWYSIKPIHEFIRRVDHASEVSLLINKDAELCVEVTDGGWVSRLHLARKVDPYVENSLTF